MVMPDLNRDGLPEAVVSTGTTLVMGNTGGTFLNPTGFAAGRYFMNINIANQPATATDPVIQMQAAFDATRASNAGMPDATRSRLTLSTGASPVEVGKRLAATVEVRDASGTLVTTPLRLIEAALRADGQPNARIDGAVVSLGGGRYRVNVVATATGQDRLLVIVDDDRGPVTIMPEPVIEVVGPRAPARAW
jgi:hypothetical protein